MTNSITLTKIIQRLCIFLLCVLFFASFLPISPNYSTNNGISVATQIVHAQGAAQAAIINAQSKGEAPAPPRPTSSVLDGVIGEVGLWIITFAGWVLTISGVLLNAVIEFSIFKFGAHIGGEGATFQGISVVWELFRNVANIVIIGVFVFIAFATILNIESYSIKKFASRVIIIALLLNFSLFFTKAIIEVSNITAIQFFKSSQLYVDNPNGVGLASVGVADVFMNTLGIASGTELEADKLKDLSKQSGGLTIAFIFSVTFFFGVLAIMFIYASILLISRAVVLVFLMAISPLAFVAYMVPKMDPYWGQWWNELIRNAFFAPLLGMFIWATIQLAFGLNVGKVGSLGGVAIKPDIQSITVLLNYLLIIGFLYLGISLASSLSTKGGKMATNGVKKLAGVGVGAGLAVSGLAARRTVGRLGHSLAESQWLKDRAKKSRFAESVRRGSKQVGNFSFNAANYKPIKSGLTTLTGDKGFASSFAKKQRGKGGATGRIAEQKKADVARVEDTAKALGSINNRQVQEDTAEKQVVKETAVNTVNTVKTKQEELGETKRTQQEALAGATAALNAQRKELERMQGEGGFPEGSPERRDQENRVNTAEQQMREKENQIKQTEAEIIENKKQQAASEDILKRIDSNEFTGSNAQAAKDRQEAYLDRTASKPSKVGRARLAWIPYTAAGNTNEIVNDVRKKLKTSPTDRIAGDLKKILDSQEKSSEGEAN